MEILSKKNIKTWSEKKIDPKTGKSYIVNKAKFIKKPRGQVLGKK